MEFTFGSLFAGIGGIDLGLERAGMVCEWQVEIDPFCLKVLEKHWPDVERFEDVKECGKHNLKAVDLVCGGFPCQDISHAGKKAGIAKGTRSGLWIEFHRIICELGPRFVVVENVAAILVRELGIVLADLAACGYDAEWQMLPAAAFGAPHIRDRCFILAYPSGLRFNTGRSEQSLQRIRLDGQTFMADIPTKAGWEVGTESRIPRISDGVSNRVDRIRTLGNAVVPQIAEWIGGQILKRFDLINE